MQAEPGRSGAIAQAPRGQDFEIIRHHPVTASSTSPMTA